MLLPPSFVTFCSSAVWSEYLANDWRIYLPTFPSCAVRGNPPLPLDSRCPWGRAERRGVSRTCAAAGLAVMAESSPLCCLPHLPEGRRHSLSKAGRTRCASASQPGISPQATTEAQAGSKWQRGEEEAAVGRNGSGCNRDSCAFTPEQHPIPESITAMPQMGGPSREMLRGQASLWVKCLQVSEELLSVLRHQS